MATKKRTPRKKKQTCAERTADWNAKQAALPPSPVERDPEDECTSPVEWKKLERSRLNQLFHVAVQMVAYHVTGAPRPYMNDAHVDCLTHLIPTGRFRFAPEDAERMAQIVENAERQLWALCDAARVVDAESKTVSLHLVVNNSDLCDPANRKADPEGDDE